MSLSFGRITKPTKKPMKNDSAISVNLFSYSVGAFDGAGELLIHKITMLIESLLAVINFYYLFFGQRVLSRM